MSSTKVISSRHLFCYTLTGFYFVDVFTVRESNGKGASRVFVLVVWVMRWSPGRGA